MIILQAAYGRKYETFEQAMKDWNAGLDFKIRNGPYTSIRDIEKLKEQFDTVVIAISHSDRRDSYILIK